MKGHVTLRGTTWTYVIDLSPAPDTGKRIRKSCGGFKTKREAQKALAEMQQQTPQ